jgi:Phosphoglycerate dehydrogenase and related dehydrogenases
MGLRAVFNLGAGVDAIAPALHRLHPGVPLIRLEDAGMGTADGRLRGRRRIACLPPHDRLRGAAGQGPLGAAALAAARQFHVGFLGLGQMGAAAARRVAAMDFPILACSRSGQSRFAAELGCAIYALDRLDEFLAQTRVLVVLLPLTADTRGLLDYAALSRLPQGAHLINASRGAVIDQADLLDLLHGGHLASALLDVFATEPLPAADALWSHPRVRITPHVAAQTLVGPSACAGDAQNCRHRTRRKTGRRGGYAAGLLNGRLPCPL